MRFFRLRCGEKNHRFSRAPCGQPLGNKKTNGNPQVALSSSGFFRRKVAEKHADHSRATADNLCMRTDSFYKTFLKSFCAGSQRVFAQTPFGRGVGQTAPQNGSVRALPSQSLCNKWAFSYQTPKKIPILPLTTHLSS